MPQLENEEIGLEGDFADPADIVDIQGVDYAPLLPLVDGFFDTMDAMAPTFPDVASFNSAFDAAFGVLEEQINSYMEANRNKPPKEHVVVVTGRRSSGLGGTARLVPTSNWAIGGVSGMPSADQLRALRENLKLIFGATDAEIDELMRQILTTPSSWAAFRRIGEIETGTDRNGRLVAIMTFQQHRQIVAALSSLGTPEATQAVSRLQAAINARRVLLLPR